MTEEELQINLDKINDVKNQRKELKKNPATLTEEEKESVISGIEAPGPIAENAKWGEKMQYNKAQKEYEKAIEKAVKEAEKEKNTRLNYELKAKQRQLENENFENALKNMDIAKAGIAGDVTSSEDYTSTIDDFKKDAEELKQKGEETKEDIIDTTTEDTTKILDKYIDLIEKATSKDPTFSVKDLPMGIINSARRGDFGKFEVSPETKKAYMDELRKPKNERNQEIIEAYNKEKKETEPARKVMGNYIVDAIATGLQNVGASLQGGSADKKSKFTQAQESKLASSLDRYNKFWEEKAGDVTNVLKNKISVDTETANQINKLYADSRIRPILNKLDLDSQVQLLLGAKNIGGKIDFSTFKNALMLQLVNDPMSSISNALGVGADILKTTGAPAIGGK